MTKLATILFILISASVLGQKKMIKKAEVAFNYYEKGKKYEALLIFKELVNDYPKSKHYGRNLYNIPTIYQEIDSTEMAIKWFQKVLEDKKLDDSEKDQSRGMLETNTNFKHYASVNIGVINYNNENYSEALKYYQLADKKYPYYNSSGTGLKLNKISIASNISDCYNKLNQVDSAIVVLIPHALTVSPGRNNNASEKIIEILKEHNRENSFFNELNKSIDNLKTTDFGVSMSCYGIDVKVIPYFDEKLTIEYLKNTEFYKELKTGNK